MSPRRYRLIVEGELGHRYASAFDGMTISAGGGVTGITRGIIDASYLQALLERIAGLGLTLDSLIPIETESAEAPAQTPGHTAGSTARTPGPISKRP